MKIITALVIDEDGYVVDLNQDNVWKWTGINGSSWGGGRIETLPDGTEDKCINISGSLYGITQNVVPDWMNSEYTISIWTKLNLCTYANSIFPGSRNTKYNGILIVSKSSKTDRSLSYQFWNGTTKKGFSISTKYLDCGSINILDSNWHHIAITRDNNNMIYLFCDGIKIFYFNTIDDLPDCNLLPPIDSPLYFNTGYYYDSNDGYRHSTGLVYRPTIIDTCLWTNDFEPQLRPIWDLAVSLYEKNNNMYGISK